MDDNQDSTIGEIIDSAAEIGKRGVRTVQAGVGTVTKAARKIPIPRVVRRVAGKDDTGTERQSDELSHLDREDDGRTGTNPPVGIVTTRAGMGPMRGCPGRRVQSYFYDPGRDRRKRG